MMARIVVQNLEPGTEIRADKFLATHFQDISRTQIRKSFDGGKVFCNGNGIRPRHSLKNGDTVEVELVAPEPTALAPHAMELEVLFEDAYLLIVNKPVGISVHAGNGVRAPTLVEGVLAHCELSKIGGGFRPGVVHRLDRDTSGAIIFAKTEGVHLALTRLFSERAIKKEYLAVVCGSMGTLAGTIDQPIGRHWAIKTKMCIRRDGRPAVTDWRLRERFGELFSLLSITPRSGRTHQIRVHMASIGHPLLGDTTYGYKSNFCSRMHCQHHVLHAHGLRFGHPITAQDVGIKAPIPAEFSAIISRLRAM
jgi:23S rRNA pseudouridine1911/1915/1917 synthase